MPLISLLKCFGKDWLLAEADGAHHTCLETVSEPQKRREIGGCGLPKWRFETVSTVFRRLFVPPWHLGNVQCALERSGLPSSLEGEERQKAGDVGVAAALGCLSACVHGIVLVLARASRDESGSHRCANSTFKREKQGKLWNSSALRRFWNERWVVGHAS